MRLPRDLQPDALLSAYASAIFPMGDGPRDIAWYRPDPRGVIELDRFKVPRSLRQTIRRGRFTVHVNRAFERVMRCCADRPSGTWITEMIVAAYCQLNRLGYAHSVETYDGDELAGGLYGVTLGGAFFGESMFTRITDGSKVALVALVERLVERGFQLLDIQFVTPHLARFGAVEIPLAEYERRLDAAVALPVDFVD